MKRSKVSTVFICLGLFLFFLILEFPYQNLRGWLFTQIYKNTQIFITAEDLSPTFLGWPGIKLSKVNISVPLATGDLELASEKTVVRGGIGGLFYPMVSLRVQKLKKGGDLYLKLGLANNFIKAALETVNLSLDQLALSGLPEPLSGIVQADGTFVYNKKELSKSTGELNLDISKFRVPAQNLQGVVLPALPIGNIKSKIIVKNGAVEINNFQLGSQNSDIRGSLSGEVRLGKDIMASYINVVLKIQLSDKYRQDPQSETLVAFLQSFQSAPGDYAMKWNATINEMSTNLVAAIPQKAN